MWIHSGAFELHFYHKRNEIGTNKLHSNKFTIYVSYLVLKSKYKQIYNSKVNFTRFLKLIHWNLILLAKSFYNWTILHKLFLFIHTEKQESCFRYWFKIQFSNIIQMILSNIFFFIDLEPKGTPFDSNLSIVSNLFANAFQSLPIAFQTPSWFPYKPLCNCSLTSLQLLVNLIATAC